jgi:iron complex outermembrane recepter protein
MPLDQIPDRAPFAITRDGWRADRDSSVRRSKPAKRGLQFRNAGEKPVFCFDQWGFRIVKKQVRSRSKFIAGLSLTTVLAGIAAPSAVSAQDAAPSTAPQAADEAPATAFGEIIVTATRKSESIQKIPISIQALGNELLEQRQVKGLTDFAALLPSVSFEGIGPGRNTAFFRGIVPAGGAYASVGYYLDDIPITGTAVPDIHVYDMERIEALSGPQGTLYGAGSLAGTIRFITNKPKLGKFEFGIDLEGNKYGKGGAGGQIQSYVNLPVSDTVALRVVAHYRKEGGYVDNVPNNGLFNDGRPSVLTLGDNNPATSFTLNNAAIARKDYNQIYEYGARVSLLWEPAPGWEITPQIEAQRQISYGYFGFDPRVGDLQVHDFDTTRNNDRWFQAQLSIHGHIGDFDLVAATGYYKRNRKGTNDYTYYTTFYDTVTGNESYLQFFDNCNGTGAAQQCALLNPTQFYRSNNSNTKFTQEIRLSAPKTWPFELTLGGFFQRQANQTNDDYSIHGLNNIVGFTQTGGGDVAGGLIGVPAQYEIAYDQDGIPDTPDDGIPYFNTANVINPNGNPLGTMALGPRAIRGDAFYITQNDTLYHDYAIFAEGHYDITPTLKFTGGIRYFWTDFAIKGFAGVASQAGSTNATFVPTGAQGCDAPLSLERLQCLNTNFRAPDQTGRYRESGQTHKVALNWQFEPSKMVYANYSTGFRPGGFSRPLAIRGFGPTDVAPFKSETLTNFELGLKSTWGGVFKLNAAIYLEKWNNIQYGVVVSGAFGAGITGNAGKAEVKGIEYDAELKLGKFTITSAGAYNDGKLKGDFCNFGLDRATASISQLPTCDDQPIPLSNPPIASTAATNGTRLPRQPQFKGTTSIRYDTNFGEYAGFIQGAALYQTGATQDLNVENNRLLVCPQFAAGSPESIGCATPGFVSFDFSAGFSRDNWRVSLFLQNAFDRRGQLTKNTFCAIDICSASSRTFTIRPQFFGIQMGYKY